MIIKPHLIFRKELQKRQSEYIIYIMPAVNHAVKSIFIILRSGCLRKTFFGLQQHSL
jgi:hypothetical protein